MLTTDLHRYELEHVPSERDGRWTSAPRDFPGAQVVRLLPGTFGEDRPRVTRSDRLRQTALSVGDLLAVLTGVLGAAGLTALPLSIAGLGVGLALTFVFVRLWGLHNKDTLVLRRSTLDEVPRLLELAALVACAYWLTLPQGPGRLPLLLLAVAVFAGLAGFRIGVRALVRALAPPERCLFIGDMAVADEVRAKVEVARTRATVIGALPLATTATAADFGGVDGLRRIVRETDVTRVILAPVSLSAADTLELIRVAKEAHVRVSIFPRLFEVIGTAVEYDELEGLTLMGVRRFGLTSSSRAMKRAFDVVGSGVAVLACLPLLALIAVLVRLDSRGPVLFRQTRVGRDGERFEILKFRSMVSGAEALKDDLRDRNETDGLFKIADDPRVTRVGRLLRSTSLDELPQLLNVLKGDMSLVGPRPLVVDEDEQVLGLDRRRLHLTPGMTGPWQIMRSGRVPMQQMVSIDYLYVANWSLWTDVKVLLRTVSYVLARRGV